MAKSDSTLTEVQKEIFIALSKNDTNIFKQLLSQLQGGVNFVDDNGMSPLQHACCKGNKEAVQALLDMGAEVNYNKHGANYTCLHFAALSGETDICRMLLDAGINPNSVSSIGRSASQMAAFVGHYACVETINNYVSREILEHYTRPQGQQTEPLVPATLLQAFHQFVIEINLHPVRIVMNLQSLGLLPHLVGLRRALELMCEKEMKKTQNVNELMALKFHYLRWIVGELLRCKEQRKETAQTNTEKNHDYVELFIKRVLKENRTCQLDYLEYVVREAVREFPFWECTIFRQVAQQLAAKEPLPALTVLRNAINGHRAFSDETGFCSSCGNEKPDKKCSKCKAVQYCDRECQRLHWFMHKKACARPVSTAQNSATPKQVDTNELREELAKMTAT